jgi:Tfp pilus assembly protein PilP
MTKGTKREFQLVTKSVRHKKKVVLTELRKIQVYIRRQYGNSQNTLPILQDFAEKELAKVKKSEEQISKLKEKYKEDFAPNHVVLNGLLINLKHNNKVVDNVIYGKNIISYVSGEKENTYILDTDLYVSDPHPLATLVKNLYKFAEQDKIF